MVATLRLQVEFEPEILIKEIAEAYDFPVTELDMDNIIDYIDDCMRIKCKGSYAIKTMEGNGRDIVGFDEDDFYYVWDALTLMQEGE